MTTDPLALARSLTAAGDAACKKGNYAEALPVEQRALELTEAALGPAHLDTAARLADVSGTLFHLRRYDESIALARRALAITEAACGTDAPEVLERLANLSLPLHGAGRLDEALRLRVRAEEAARRLLPREDPWQAIHAANLARTLEELERYGEALPHRQEALRVALHCFGDHDLRTLRRLAELGATLTALERPAEAVRALEPAARRLPADHPERTFYLYLWGTALLRAGQAKAAKAVLEEARAGGEQAGDVTLGNVAMMLGECLEELSRFEEARACYAESAARAKEPEARYSRRDAVARMLGRLSRPEEALALRWENLRAYSPPDRRTAERLGKIADRLTLGQDAAGALEANGWQLALLGLLDGVKSLAYAEALGERGWMLRVFGDLHAAIATLESALGLLDQYVDEGARARRIAAARLNQYRELRAEIQASIGLRRVLAELLLSALGPDHPEVVRRLLTVQGTYEWAHQPEEARAVARLAQTGPRGFEELREVFLAAVDTREPTLGLVRDARDVLRKADPDPRLEPYTTLLVGVCGEGWPPRD